MIILGDLPENVNEAADVPMLNAPLARNSIAMSETSDLFERLPRISSNSVSTEASDLGPQQPRIRRKSSTGFGIIVSLPLLLCANPQP